MSECMRERARPRSYCAADAACVNWPSSRSHPKRAAGLLTGEFRAAVPDIALERHLGGPSDGNDPIVSTFAFHPDQIGRRVRELQGGEFRNTQTGRIQDLQNGAVSQHEWLVAVEHLEDGRQVPLWQGLGQPMRPLRPGKMLCRVGGNDSPAGRVRIESSNRRCLSDDRPPSVSLPVQVSEKPPNEAPIDGVDRACSILLAEDEELAQVTSIGGNRVLSEVPLMGKPADVLVHGRFGPSWKRRGPRHVPMVAGRGGEVNDSQRARTAATAASSRRSVVSQPTQASVIDTPYSIG